MSAVQGIIIAVFIITVIIFTTRKRRLEQGNAFTGVCLPTGARGSLSNESLSGRPPLTEMPLDRDPPGQTPPPLD